MSSSSRDWQKNYSELINQINSEQDDNKKAHLMRRLSFQMFQTSRKLLVHKKYHVYLAIESNLKLNGLLIYSK